MPTSGEAQSVPLQPTVRPPVQRPSVAVQLSDAEPATPVRQGSPLPGVIPLQPLRFPGAAAWSPAAAPPIPRCSHPGFP